MRLAERAERVGFTLDGWRRLAYWQCVMFLGLSMGGLWAHPGTALPLSGALGLEASPSADEVRRMANLAWVVTFVLLVAILGRGALMEQPEEVDRHG